MQLSGHLALHHWPCKTYIFLLTIGCASFLPGKPRSVFFCCFIYVHLSSYVKIVNICHLSTSPSCIPSSYHRDREKLSKLVSVTIRVHLHTDFNRAIWYSRALFIALFSRAVAAACGSFLPLLARAIAARNARDCHCWFGSGLARGPIEVVVVVYSNLSSHNARFFQKLVIQSSKNKGPHFSVPVWMLGGGGSTVLTVPPPHPRGALQKLPRRTPAISSDIVCWLLHLYLC